LDIAKNNPVDFIIDVTLFKIKNVKSIIQDEDYEFTERVINLGLKNKRGEIIPLNDLPFNNQFSGKVSTRFFRLQKI
jgi:hypothetical protein